MTERESFDAIVAATALTMDLRASINSLSFGSALVSPCHFGNKGETERKSPSSRVQFPICQVGELTPKELHHKRKKEEWKNLRRARRLEKLAEQARVQEREAREKEKRRRDGLCSFEKYKLAKDRGVAPPVEWKSGVKGKSTLMSKFEEEFAIRVRDAVKTVTCENSEVVENFREDSHSVLEGEDVSDDWLLAYARRSNGDVNFPGTHFEITVDDEKIHEVGSGSNVSVEDNGSRIIDDRNLEVQRKEGTSDTSIVTDCQPDELSRSGNGAGEVASAFFEQDVHVDNNMTANSFSRSQLHFIDHSFSNQISLGRTSGSSGTDNNNVVSTHSRHETDARTADDEEEASLGTLEPRDWRVNPKIPRRKDKAVGWQIISRRKGEPLSLLLDENSDEISSETHGILDALHEDVNSEVRRKPVDEREQLEWLVEECVSDLTFVFCVVIVLLLRWYDSLDSDNC